MNLNAKMVEKAKAAKTAEELFEIAKANGVDMTVDEAKTYFAQLNPKIGEIDDDDLDNVAGGACKNSDGDTGPAANVCPNCQATLKTMVGSSADTMKLECISCGAVFAAYMKENFSVLHPVK